MNGLRYVVNFLLMLLPVSHCFRLKQVILNYVGIVALKGVSVNGHTWFYGRGKVEIGENTWVGPRCRFYSHQSVTISIGKNCDIAPEVAFVTGSHEIGAEKRRAGRGYCKPIVVGDGCWIGARATILGGVSIGQGAIIGAGALVREDVPANTIVAGVPAKQIRSLDVNGV